MTLRVWEQAGDGHSGRLASQDVSQAVTQGTGLGRCQTWYNIPLGCLEILNKLPLTLSVMSEVWLRTGVCMGADMHSMDPPFFAFPLA